MKCPFCHHSELKVTDSRNACDVNAIRRRRECLSCCRRFTTFEMVEPIIQVLKRDGHYQDFQEQKLIQGMESACRHTRLSHEQVRVIASEITREIMDKQSREISSKQIGEMVMDKLKDLDMIAYIRFACVYRRFKDVEELIEEIQASKSGEKTLFKKEQIG